MTRALILVLICLVPAACTYTPVADDCGAAGLQRYIGEPVVAVAALDREGRERVLEPGARPTASDPDRLTIVPDAKGRIVALYCG